MISIAIDGPSGAGKSTIAKRVAQELDIEYIDTGAMYRAVAYKTVRNDIDPDNADAMQSMLDDTTIDFISGKVILDGEDVSGNIRTSEMSQMASRVSAIASVRTKLVELQRRMGESKSVIMDGRDIGTNVLTSATHKFFMTASAEERARRRFIELEESGEDVSLDNVLEDIKKRDKNDTERELNPLRQADDAIVIDTDGLDIEQVTQLILKHIVTSDQQC